MADKNKMSLDSSATYKWGVLTIRPAATNVGVWSTAGFFKTEKAAKNWAMELGVSPVLIARRFDRLELKRSRGVA